MTWLLLWLLGLTVAFTRFALAQRDIARDIADLKATDRRFRTSARVVRVVGTGAMVAVGIGERIGDIYELAALQLQLRVEDGGELLPIEAGAKLRVILRAGSFQGGVLRVPVDQRLLCRMPPLVEGGDAVEVVLSVLRGEPITLLDPTVDLFYFVRRTRIASLPRIALVVAGVTLALQLRQLPLHLGLYVAFLADQVALRGTLFAVACTKWRDPQYWKDQT